MQGYPDPKSSYDAAYQAKQSSPEGPGRSLRFSRRIRHYAVGTSQPLAAAQTPQVVEVLSDSEDEQPAQATPAADGQVAQLMDMGFTPEQAAQVPTDCQSDYWRGHIHTLRALIQSQSPIPTHGF